MTDVPEAPSVPCTACEETGLSKRARNGMSGYVWCDDCNGTGRLYGDNMAKAKRREENFDGLMRDLAAPFHRSRN